MRDPLTFSLWDSKHQICDINGNIYTDGRYCGIPPNADGKHNGGLQNIVSYLRYINQGSEAAAPVYTQ